MRKMLLKAEGQGGERSEGKGRAIFSGASGAYHVLAVLFFGYFLLLAVKPLSDPDLWWHLSAGKWIWENGAIPSSDHFSHTTTGPLSDNQLMGLRGQWLGQVLFYLVYLIGGYQGLSVFRAVLIVAPFAAIYLLFVRRGLHPLLVLSTASLPLLLVILSLYYAYERPQAFSFLLALCAAGALAGLRGRSPGWRPLAALFALIMALWSNLHGMFIFGVLILAAYGGGLLLEAAYQRSARRLYLLAPLGAGVFASLANPNTHKILTSYFQGFFLRFLSGPGEKGAGGELELLEFQSLLYFYREYHFVWPLFMAAFTGVAVLVFLARCVRRKRIEPPEAFVFSLFVFFGFYYARVITMSLLVLSFFILFFLGDLGKRLRLITGVLAAVLSLALVVVTLQRTPMHLVPLSRKALVHGTYPEGAVRFLRENAIEGRMFNDLLWGGYLGWKLYPDYRVFIDGRLLDRRVFEAYSAVMAAGPGWQGKLDAYGVDFILIRAMRDERGTIFPLVLRFLDERPEGWRLVFSEGNSALFLRDGVNNGEVLKRFALPVDVLYVPILRSSENLLRNVPGHPEALLSKAVALYGLGRYAEAAGILRGLPSSPLRDSYLKRLEGTFQAPGLTR